jgi:alpha-mannosidase
LSSGGVAPDADRPVTDQGLHRVRIRLAASAGRRDLGTPETAAALSRPLRVAFEGTHPGETTQATSFFRCRPSTVHLTSLKAAEDGDGFVVRLVETRGRKARAVVTGPEGFKRIETALRPFEIQSWRWPAGAAPVLCDLLEEPI